MRRIDAMSRQFSVNSFQWSVSSLRLNTAHWLLITCFALLLGTASAQTGLSIQLVPETTAIVPGQPFRVGIYIQHQPGWHTYWRQPGIVGVPTSIAWELPEGFTAGPLEYPEPESVLMFQIKAQGYERDVLLQTLITPPKELPLGKKIFLQGKATWMCCGNTCHPGHGELSLSLSVAAEARPDFRWAPLFEKERAAYVRPSDDWTSSATEKGLQVTLHLTPGPKARPFQPDEKVIFFTEDGWINSDEPQPQIVNADGSLTVHLTRADVFLGKTIPSRLEGVVQREGGWLPNETWRSLGISPVLERE
ncbi:Thiol-disulfide interchange protein, contains DsbC and DsbD domains [Prosthecobacter debontii]|uniref:Thiol-disulfide interchange protein, contains DsbC and DsbD domains n=1 Tax=Prosthecobacter debontii TaxID=48467 RepID=A0A1T4YMX9_9BACT|nr:protein-disulfide reductase DsbD domain-containing protein [Prosthecobacter debontii]SKB03116.1 Thiol-disulfide interchange protein, contains DsbC and DsbD domains [Prosthecobacter debontii]